MLLILLVRIGVLRLLRLLVPARAPLPVRLLPLPLAVLLILPLPLSGRQRLGVRRLGVLRVPDAPDAWAPGCGGASDCGPQGWPHACPPAGTARPWSSWPPVGAPRIPGGTHHRRAARHLRARVVQRGAAARRPVPLCVTGTPTCEPTESSAHAIGWPPASAKRVVPLTTPSQAG
ncbi:hypothetical protein SMICM304S_12119 [Streptomyces microflavus]